jgi:hypothetical protein
VAGATTIFFFSFLIFCLKNIYIYIKEEEEEEEEEENFNAQNHVVLG